VKGLHTRDYRLILKSEPEVIVLAVSQELSVLQTARRHLQRLVHSAMHHEGIDASSFAEIPRAIAQAVLDEVWRRSTNKASRTEAELRLKVPDSSWRHILSYLVPRRLPLWHSQVKRVLNVDMGARAVSFQDIKTGVLKAYAKTTRLYADASPLISVADATGHVINESSPRAVRRKLRVVITFRSQRILASLIMHRLQQCSHSIHDFTQLACVCPRFYLVSRIDTLWFPMVKGVDLRFMTSTKCRDPELRKALSGLAGQTSSGKDLLERHIALSLGTYSDSSTVGFQPENNTCVYDLCAARSALAQLRRLSEAAIEQAAMQEQCPRFWHGLKARKEEAREALVHSGIACTATFSCGLEVTPCLTGGAGAVVGAVVLGPPAAAIGAVGSCIAGQSRGDIAKTAFNAVMVSGCVVGGPAAVAGGIAGVAGGAACGVAASTVRITEGTSLGVGGLAGNLADSLRRCPDKAFGGWEGELDYSSGIHCHQKGVIWGLAKGLKSFSKECTGAVIGLVREPVKGVMEDGALGACKGVGRSLVGLVAKPAAGVLDITGGVLRGAGNRIEHVRHFTLVQELRGELTDVRSKLRGAASRGTVAGVKASELTS
jgi:hypothetical protein